MPLYPEAVWEGLSHGIEFIKTPVLEANATMHDCRGNNGRPGNGTEAGAAAERGVDEGQDVYVSGGPDKAGLRPEYTAIC